MSDNKDDFSLDIDFGNSGDNTNNDTGIGSLGGLEEETGSKTAENSGSSDYLDDFADEPQSENTVSENTAGAQYTASENAETTDSANVKEPYDPEKWDGMSLFEVFEEEGREEEEAAKAKEQQKQKALAAKRAEEEAAANRKKQEEAEREAREARIREAAEAERERRRQQVEAARREKEEKERENTAREAADQNSLNGETSAASENIDDFFAPAEGEALASKKARPETQSSHSGKHTKASKKQKKEDSPELKAAKKVISAATIGLLSIVLIVVALCLVMLKRSTYSDTERRTLATFPSFSLSSWFSGDFADGVTEYFTDTVPNRDALKDIAGTITALKGVSAGGVVIINPGDNYGGDSRNTDDDDEEISIAPNKTPSGATATPTPTPDADATPTPVDFTPTPTPTPTEEPTPSPTSIPDQNAEGGDNEVYTVNGLVIIGTRCMEIFGGSVKVAKTYAANLNLYKEALGDSVNVYSMVLPSAAAYYYEGDSSRRDTLEIINTVTDNLSEGVTNIDVFSALDKHTSEYIYLRTDHHWTPLAAYYAWCEFATAANIACPSIYSDAYTIAQKDNYLGSLYGESNANATLRSHPDTFIYYKPTNSYTVKYLTPQLQARDGTSLFYEDFTSDYYMIVSGTNERVTEIHTDVGSGRTLVIVKDSFGNQLCPFAVTAFDNIYMVDARYFEANLVDFIKEKGATDVLFACCAFQASSTAPVGNTYVDNIGSIRVW